MPITTSKLIALLIPCLYLLQGLRHRRMVLADMANQPTLPDAKYDQWLIRVNKTRKILAEVLLTVGALSCIFAYFYIYRNMGLDDAAIDAKYSENTQLLYGRILFVIFSGLVISGASEKFYEAGGGLRDTYEWLVDIYAVQNYKKKDDWEDNVCRDLPRTADYLWLAMTQVPFRYYVNVFGQILFIVGTSFACLHFIFFLD